MKIAVVTVMGAGAVGCFFGARLQQAGHEVTLIGRAALVEAVAAHGLHLTMRGFDGFLPIQVSVSPQAACGAQLLLFCVKSGDTESAGAALLPFLDPQCPVLSLQNGVDNAGRLAAVLGREVIGAAVYVAAEMAGPGHVLHHGRGEILMAQTSASEALARALNGAGIPTTVTARVEDALWSKLTVNCVYNALSALTQLSYGELLALPGMREVMHDVFQECWQVAAASGVRLPENLWDEVLGVGVSMPGQHSSTAQDVARGRRSEIDYINGHIVREGERVKVATPVNRCLHSLVRAKDAQIPLT